MGFITNILEDWENFLIEVINEEKLFQMKKQEERLSLLTASLKQRQGDILVLFQEGFNYDTKKDKYYKTEDINYGKYPGKYKISVKFPVNYPKRHPDIRFRPLHHGKVSKHISSNGDICLSEEEHGNPYSFWQPNMNVIGALKQGYHLVTDEIHTKENKRRKIPIGGTIFKSLSKKVDKKTFVAEFAKPHKIKMDWTYDWEEIAYAISQTEVNTKGDLIKYYNKVKRRK